MNNNIEEKIKRLEKLINDLFSVGSFISYVFAGNGKKAAFVLN